MRLETEPDIISNGVNGGDANVSWILLFLVILIIAGIFGFWVMAGLVAWIARVLFVIFLIFLILDVNLPPSEGPLVESRVDGKR